TGVQTCALPILFGADQLSGTPIGFTLGRIHQGQFRFKPSHQGSRQRSLWTGEGKTAYYRVSGRIKTKERHESADPLFSRASGSRKNLARKIYRESLRP